MSRSTAKPNPEKTASVYDTKFQKKWMDSCDEAEKILIREATIQATENGLVWYL
ncbi:MAG: DUF3169 family protein [Lachnospiraceae bacterium]|nr:DUF3169 family protein [Lachnospiraceae bacterium]